MTARFCRLSAPGAAGLSIWLLLGPDEEAFVAVLGRPLPERDRPARVRLPDGSGGVLDEGLCWLRRCRKDLPELELHLHGGRGVAAALRERLAGLGWVEDPGLAADPDLQELLAARSPAAAAAATVLLGGRFERLLQRLRAAPAPVAARAARRLLRRCRWARLLESPPRVVLAGPPNTGKSTLFNAWLAEERVTVSPHPGTTRDAVDAGLLLGTGPAAFEAVLTDTAGLWDEADGVDRRAVALALETIRDAWRVVWVCDAREAPPPGVRRALAGAHPEDLRLQHRCDLAAGGAGWDPGPGGWLRCSTLEEGGTLPHRLVGRLLAPLRPPPPGALVPLGRARRAALRSLVLGLS